MISSMVYYIFYSSAVLFYGIGLNRSAVACVDMKGQFMKGIKSLFTVTSSAVLSYLVCKSLLVPYSLSELYPFVCALIYISISVFYESIVRITSRNSSAEFSISLLSILLSVNEGTSLLRVTIISLSCVLSFYLFVPILHAIFRRIEAGERAKDFSESALVFLSMAVILLALFAWNVSWFNSGVAQ